MTVHLPHLTTTTLGNSRAAKKPFAQPYFSPPSSLSLLTCKKPSLRGAWSYPPLKLPPTTKVWRSTFAYLSQEIYGSKKIDTCVIRTHAPEGNAWLWIAGHRVNHSAKVPETWFDGRNSFRLIYNIFRKHVLALFFGSVYLCALRARCVIVWSWPHNNWMHSA